MSNGNGLKSRVAVLPSLATLSGLMCGFAAIGVTAQAQVHVHTVQEAAAWRSFALAGGLILLAMFFDMVDGLLARATGQSSEFGAQLDSLCDMVSFGVAPACIVFFEVASRNLLGHNWYAFVAAGFYVVCVALRLARFNVETDTGERDHLHFRGLPCPAAAGVIASLAIFEWRLKYEAWWAARCMPFAVVILGGLMISRVRYLHLTNALLYERRPFNFLAALILCLFATLAAPLHYEYVLLAGFTGYVLWGIVSHAWALIRGRQAVKAGTTNDP